MFKGVARITLPILICIPLLVIAFLITKQVQSAFELRKSFIDGNNLHLPFSDLEQIMATNELSTRSFFLIFICFLMILCGLLIVLKGTGNALSLASEQKVRYSLKTVYPGLIMSIAGCLLLTYSIYKSAQTHFRTTKELINLKTQKSVILAPTLAIEDQANVALSPLDTLKPVESQMEGIPVAMPQNVKATTHLVKQIVTHTNPIKTDVATVEEVNWAGTLAVRSITNGYAPTANDRARYEQITNSANATSKINTSLDWAFHFLMRTQNGYQPSADELDEYERVVTNYVSKRTKSIVNEGDRASK